MKDIKGIWTFIARKEILAIIAVSVLVGFFLRGMGQHEPVKTETPVQEVAGEDTVEFWTCSMHPQIHQPGPGQCPICGMDLIPVTSGSDQNELSARELKLSPAAVKLAEIQVATVSRQHVQKEIRMSGKVAYDETRIRYITAWLPGRIDKLFVDYTGITVRKGEPLAELYSPDLYTAQEELIQSLRAADELKGSTLSTTRETALRTVESSREKMRLLGVTDEQIAAFEKNGRPTNSVTVFSPISGVVIHKNATEGLYVKTGSRIYTVADLSTVWVSLDVYESDLAWIRVGQEVAFSAEAYPDESFTGKIIFIDPLLNNKTRTVKVRVNVKNADGKLKPDMFVKAVVSTDFMPGSPATADAQPLVIPATAPLITGKRAVVYVANPDIEGVYEGREIGLGPRVEDYYIVESGLEDGESVVVNGNFKIDSALQILAKPSMMNPAGGVMSPAHDHGDNISMLSPPVAEAAEPEHDHGQGKTGAAGEFAVPQPFLEQLGDVYQAYFHIQFALSHDNAAEAKKGVEHLAHALSGVDMELLQGDAHMAWMKELNEIKANGALIAGAGDIDAARKAFIPLSQSLINVAKMFGTSGESTIYQFHCPMADNNAGADWLQNKADIANPFFGSSMFTCGSIVDSLAVKK